MNRRILVVCAIILLLSLYGAGYFWFRNTHMGVGLDSVPSTIITIETPTDNALFWTFYPLFYFDAYNSPEGAFAVEWTDGHSKIIGNPRHWKH